MISKTKSKAKAQLLLEEAKAEMAAQLKAADAEREAEEEKRRAAAREVEQRLAEMKGTSEREDQKRESEVRRAMEQVNRSEKTDLCFMVDATGSMAGAIAGVKEQIKQIVMDVQKTNPALKLRIAITGYRDALEAGKGNGTKSKVNAMVNGDNSPFDFTDSLDTFVSNVGKIEARGGGDCAEDVASGFRDVLSFAWRSPTRVLFFIADAPSHGSRYNGGCGDNHKQGDHGIPGKLKQLQQMDVDVVFCSMNETTTTMIDAMNQDVGPGQDGKPFITTVPMSDPAQLLRHATKQLRQSMQKTLTGSRTPTKKKSWRKPGLLSLSAERTDGGADGDERKLDLIADQPNWVSMPSFGASLYTDEHVDLSALCVGSCKPSSAHGLRASTAAGANVAKLGGLFRGGSKGKAKAAQAEEKEAPPDATRDATPARKFVCEKINVQVAPEPFATGNVRFARYGRIFDGPGGSTRPCVFKDFKTSDRRQHGLERYLVEMEVNAVAAALATEFNRVACPPSDKQMSYVGASVATVREEAEKGPAKESHYFVEEMLHGEFTRFSYNSGYWEEERLDEWLLRFALWTVEFTGGYLMVTDLQGVVTDEGYILTDPVVLCTDLSRFGSTNLGGGMMARCRASTEAHLEALAGAGAVQGIKALARIPPPKEASQKPPSRAESREEPEPLLANGLTTLREANEEEEW